MTLRADGKQIKALVPKDVAEDLERLQVHFGLPTASSLVSFAIRRLAISEFQDKNQATPLNEREAA